MDIVESHPETADKDTVSFHLDLLGRGEAMGREWSAKPNNPEVLWVQCALVNLRETCASEIVAGLYQSWRRHNIGSTLR